MKLSTITMLGIALTTLSNAQNNITADKGKVEKGVIIVPETDVSGELNSVPSESKVMPDGIMLQGTIMVQLKNGIIKPLEKDVVLSNGIRIRKDGYIFRKNRPKMLLNVDEFIDTSGKIHPINKSNSFITN